MVLESRVEGKRKEGKLYLFNQSLKCVKTIARGYETYLSIFRPEQKHNFPMIIFLESNLLYF